MKAAAAPTFKTPKPTAATAATATVSQATRGAPLRQGSTNEFRNSYLPDIGNSCGSCVTHETTLLMSPGLYVDKSRPPSIILPASGS